MADIPIWEGTSSFTPGSTPFSFYDSDADFQQDADKVARYCVTRLGFPIMDVELQPIHLYAAFEDAVTEYGNEVFQYKVRENYLSMEGGEKGTDYNNQLINPSLDRVIGISKEYGTEAEVGGNLTKYSGLLQVEGGKQEYDLDKWAEDEGVTGGVEIRRVFYEAPPAILRFFDPFAGTGTGVQSLMDVFDFGSFSPGVNFLLMPTSYDALKIQAIEFNDQIRKSSFSFELVNNQLKLFPIPINSGVIRIEYYKLSEKNASRTQDGTTLITNIGEVPYKNPVYSQINSIGRQWIFRYTLASAKESLAYIRGKYQTVPIPGDETTLNQADLLADARSEKESLINSLRETLEQTSRESQLEKQSNESSYLKETLNNVPFPIYVK